MENTQAQQLLREGIRLARNPEGREAARQCLREATDLDPACETGWLWLAALADSPDEALESLEQVLTLHPGHEKAICAARAARLQCGINAAKQQDKPRARNLLRQTTADNPADEMGWLWLASVAETSAEGVLCLERVLQLNPGNERARSSLERFRAQTATVRLVTSSPSTAVLEETQSEDPQIEDPETADDWTCPFCETPIEEKSESCLECGALLILASVENFENHPEGDSERLLAFVADVEATDYQDDFAICYRLGLAKMNLRQYEAAHAILKHALWLKPENEDLRALVEELPRFVRQKARDTLSGSGRTILIVDDNPTVRQFVLCTLVARSYLVRTAGDGYEAVDVLRDHGAPDLILLDVNMPGMDGLQLCKLLRQNADTARLPIIMLSERDGFFSKIRGSMAGSTEYLTKPFEARALVEVVERYCLQGSYLTM